MKNIFQIFYHDIKKIRKNVIALIVILGITIVPSLYAWFNIAASWDPYGNTAAMMLLTGKRVDFVQIDTPKLKDYTRTNRETNSQRIRISNLPTDNMESTARLVRQPMP